MNDKLFMGSGLCPVDLDGGIVLPSFILAPLALRSDGKTVLLGGHETDVCLAGYDSTQAVGLQLECRRRGLEGDEAKPGSGQAQARRIFGLLHVLSIDADGRCILPALLRHRARIRDRALIVGTGDMFEIWGLMTALYSHDAGMRALAAVSRDVSEAA